MSEFEPRFESKEKHELSPEAAAEIDRKAAEVREREAAKAEAKRDSIEAIRERLEKAQEKQKDVRINKDTDKGSADTAHLTSTGLKSHGLKQTKKRVQKQLKPADRAFSKFIHNGAVETISNATESTVARPSGLLFAGLFSLLTSLVVLYISRHYGYEYNFLVGLASMGAGFILGLVFEGLYRSFKKLRHR